MRRLVLLMLFASVLRAAEDRLAAIQVLLVPMRATPIAAAARGATPALTDVKHQLRDWIESRITGLQWNGDRWTPTPAVLEEQLNDGLGRAGLACPPNARCLENPLGYLGRVVLETQPGFLMVRTSIGVQVCGTDDSAYIYELTDDRWRRIWQSEQNNYEEKTYFPQRLVDVKISPTDWRPESDHTEHLIVTTGVFPWCSSVWQPIYYRIWQTNSTYSAPRLLLDESEQADIAAPIHARANQKDVFIEFQIIAADAMRVSDLRHYVLEKGRLRRTDPVALTPQDFVSFWLRDPWAEVSEWTARNGRAILKAWRQRYQGTDSEFTPPTRHCTLHPDLWQVATDPGSDPRPSFRYFLIRARPPFRFTIVAAADHPWPDCTEGDPTIDDAPGFFDK
jgi:hypothetical protein